MQNNQVPKFSHGESEACMQMDLDQTHGWGPWHRQKVWIVSLHTKLKLACVCVCSTHHTFGCNLEDVYTCANENGEGPEAIKSA